MNAEQTASTTGLAQLMAMKLSPISPESSNRMRCRICWEASDSVEDLTEPCGCKSDMKYAHDRCIREWVRKQRRYSCTTCCQPYRLDFEPLAYREIMRRNAWILMMALLQILMPISVYLNLHHRGLLDDYSVSDIQRQLCMLVILYSLMGFSLHRMLQEKSENRGVKLEHTEV